MGKKTLTHPSQREGGGDTGNHRVAATEIMRLRLPDCEPVFHEQ
jgi:hypothetical protein